MKLKSWDGTAINDGTNFEAAWGGTAPHGLPAVQADQIFRTGRWPAITSISRPGRLLTFTIYKRAGSTSTLTALFDPEDETVKRLVVEDSGGGNDRYVEGICEGFEEVPYRAGKAYMATIRVSGDPRWRETTATTDTFSITATGDQDTFTNGGQDDAYPILKIKPTSAKSGGFTFKRPIFIRWKVSTGALKYPIDIANDSLDTATIIGGGDMQADGDDLRVYLAGSEIDRWLDGINTASTKVWCNLDFQPAIEMTLGTAIASSGAISTIDLSAMEKGQFASLPYSGLVVIDSEAFSYTSRNLQTMQLEGVIRAVKGTSEASHAAASTVWWLQHDLTIFYGDTSLSAPATDDDYKPIFNLATSTNTSWDYDEFGNDAGTRTGAWAFVNSTNSSIKYTANQYTDADPWTEIGIANLVLGTTLSYASWRLTNPCGFTNANFQNGEKRSETNTGAWYASIQTRNAAGAYTLEDTIAAPSTTATWESWSDSEALTAGTITILLQLQRAAGIPGGFDQKLEVADVTMTLDSSNTPSITIGAEQSNYAMTAKITNLTTGDAMYITFAGELDQELEIDTARKTVTYLADYTNHFSALALVGGPRRDWLRFAPGANLLQFDDTGTGNVTISLEWEERFYQ